jgi:hypothetical protein
MALTITDVSKSAAEVGIAAVTIDNGATAVGAELDRGENVAVEGVTALLTVTGFAAAPSAGGYMTVRLASLLGIDLGGVVSSVGRWVRNALGDIGDFLGLADGGTITMPGTVLVGERGPELLTLPRGAQVTPLDRAGGTIVVPVYLDGREIARATLPHQAREMQLRGVTS